MIIQWLSDFISHRVMVGQHLFFWHWGEEEKPLPKVIKLSVVLKPCTAHKIADAISGHRIVNEKMEQAPELANLWMWDTLVRREQKCKAE